VGGSVKRDPNGRTWGFVFDARRAPGAKRRQVKRRGFATRREATQAMRLLQVQLDAEPAPGVSDDLVTSGDTWAGWTVGRRAQCVRTRT
jgi:hypothetical protein